MTLTFWLSVLVTTAVLVLAGEVGYVFGRRARPEVAVAMKDSVAVTVSANLALLGLMLGFTFSMVDERFSNRRAVVIDDANAIGTTYLRASLLPPPHDARVTVLLREYVDLRVHTPTRRTIAHYRARTDELQTSLWNEARAITAIDPHSQVTNLFVSTLNEMIDMNAKRLAIGLYQRLPDPIRGVLYATAVFAFAAFGYTTGLARRRAFVASTIFVLAVSTVMTFIVEENRPLAATLRVELDPYRDLQQQMERDRTVQAAQQP